ncbi:3-5 exonuclease [Coniochaeta hoffmannii]|uniref:3-5 exonuclease n=1 Tax=Coniochaeta hoffmannii TaxID=91930 RepID=A0AA38RKF1_9PEZI|nr:3-5 exonuclease [Coniochaeta hoffmannii]
MATSTSSPIFITSVQDLPVFLSSITQSSTLYLDLEGKNLSRNGTLSIITVLVQPAGTTNLIDIQTLGDTAFATATTGGKTLKSILEDPLLPKYVWDVRNDADALWAHHRVKLAGVTDVQLLENGSRPGDKTYLRGLGTCVEKDLKLNFMEVHRWVKTKKEVQALMGEDIFSRRPLDVRTMQYCANDVLHLPALRELYAGRINSVWMQKAMEESGRRVADACCPTYEPQYEGKKLGPWGWGSGLGETVLTMDEWLEKYEDDRMDAMQAEWLGYDDYKDSDCYDWPLNSRDAAFDDTFDSC